jgi:hypothetical protein
VTRDDEGVYVCTARNPAGESEDRLNVIVERPQQRPELPGSRPPQFLPPAFRPGADDGQVQIDRAVFQVLHGRRAEMTCNIIARGKNTSCRRRVCGKFQKLAFYLLFLSIKNLNN